MQPGSDSSRPGSAATILDVARVARVSAGTVSRVLNGEPSVDAEKVQRVRRAIEALNYSPRQRKASLVDLFPLRGKNILLLTLGLDRSLAALPVVAAAMEGVEQAVREAQANLLVAGVPALDRVPDALARKRVDGLILKGALQGDLVAQSQPELIRRLRCLSTVWILGRPPGAWGDVVQVDDTSVGRLAADYLTEHGHQRLAFLSPKPSQVTLMRRQASFMFFAERSGAKVKAFLGDARKWTFPSAAVKQLELVESLVERILREPQPPTAIFAPDDSIGVLTTRALSARGIRVGRDMSLISCNNDQALLLAVDPALTTIEVHASAIGRRAVDQLAWRIKHLPEPAVDLGLEPALVEGRSVGIQRNERC